MGFGWLRNGGGLLRTAALTGKARTESFIDCTNKYKHVTHSP